MITEGIRIVMPEPIHNNFGLEIYMPSNPAKVAEFERICRQKLMNGPNAKILGTFFQGGLREKTWKYFEFLKTGPFPDAKIQDLILDIALEIAEKLGMELDF